MKRSEPAEVAEWLSTSPFRFEHKRFPPKLSEGSVIGAESRTILATVSAVCSLENYLVLPDHTMDERIREARKALGRDVVVLGHHYQRDEVIRLAISAAIPTSFPRRRRKRQGNILFFAACISWRRAQHPQPSWSDHNPS